MKKPVKLIAAVLISAAVLGGVTYALTPEDSLVTLKHITGVFMPSALKKGELEAENRLKAAYDGGMEQLDQAQAEITGTSKGPNAPKHSSTLVPMDCHDREVFEAVTGTGFLMQEGVASVTHNGVFVDVTEGKEVPSGTDLIRNHRYLVGEDTIAKVEILSGAARLGVQGDFLRSGGVSNPMPFYDVSRNDWYYGQISFAYERNYLAGIGEHEFGPTLLMNRAMVMTVFYKLAGLPQAEMDAAAEVKFTDVPEDSWYAPYVRWAYSQGVTAGTGETTFSPLDNVTREQFAQLLYNFTVNYLKKPQPQRADYSYFTDASSVHGWAEDAVAWGVSVGILQSMRKDVMVLLPTGFSDRAALAVMLWTYSVKVS